VNPTIIECVQGEPEWYAARLGIPTASEFDTVCAEKGPRGGAPKGRRTYMLKLIGERLTGQPAESYSNGHMERGKVMEAEARDLYAMLTGYEPRQVGFISIGDAGCSPDSLIGGDGMLEVKTKLPHIQLDVLLSGEIPAEHVRQLQGQLWVSGRQWVDFLSYWPGLAPFIKRVHRNEDAISDIAKKVAGFNAELLALMERVAPRQAAA
jgi:hypothetical protein